MKVIVSHPTGNTFVRALVQELYVTGALSSFHTTISWNCQSRLSWLFPMSCKELLMRRDFGIPHNAIRNNPLREIIRLSTGRLPWLSIAKNGLGSVCLDSVYRDMDRFTSRYLLKEKPTHVHCYEDGALETFRVARDNGIFCSYELPIAYWKTLHGLLRKEELKWPEWSKTLVFENDTICKLDRKDKELDLADQIIVPSKFVKNSLPQKVVDAKPVIVAPFGSPRTNHNRSDQKAFQKPMRFLFVGSMGQRKGLADLLEAFSKNKRDDIQLVVLGSLLMPLQFYQNIYPDFIYECPRSHAKVLELMETCHVLALPSIVEGRALVQQEAMSKGLALLITPNSGGEDLVIEGITGHIVPQSSSCSLIEAINKFADDPEKTLNMGISASKHAENYSWEEYCKTIVSSFESKS